MKLVGVSLLVAVTGATCLSGAWGYPHAVVSAHGGQYCWGQFSADGRYVTYSGNGADVPEDTNGCNDVFLYDRATGERTRLSVASDGTEGNGDSWGGGISQDGRYVVFRSEASNLVPGDTNGVSDVFVRDRATSQTFRVSVSSQGVQGNSDSFSPGLSGGRSASNTISGDGRYVAFQSDASNLVPGDTNGVTDVFVHDLWTHRTTRVSVASDGSQATKPVHLDLITPMGQVIMSGAGDCGLAPGATHEWDLYLHDPDTGETMLLDPDLGAEDLGGASAASGDGRVVCVTGLAPGLTGSGWVWDRATNTTTRLDVDSGSGQADAVTADGRLVVLHAAGTGDITTYECYAYDTDLGVINSCGSDAGILVVSPSGNALGDTSLEIGGGPWQQVLRATDLSGTSLVPGADYSFGSIAGTVTVGGAPVAGAQVWADGLWAETDAEGNYQFPVAPVKDGGSGVMATADGQYAYAFGVPVATGETATVDLALGPVGAIAGTVRDEQTGTPLSSALVTCGEFSTRTRADGSYRLNHVPVAVGLTVTASHALYHDASVSGVTVTAGHTTPVDLLLHTTLGGISGTVRDADSQGGVSGASVSCGALSTTTGPDGRYTLAGVPEGTGMTVTANHQTHRPVTVADVSVVGGYATPVDFVLPRRIGAVKGRVADSVTGMPIAGASIALGDLTGESDAQGAYLFPKVMIGSYDVIVSAPAYTTATFPVVVEEGRITLLPLPLAAVSTGTITGTVTDATSHAPLNGALVSCGGAQAYTVNGAFVLPGVAVGSGYEVGAAARGFHWALRRDVSVAAGQTTEVDLSLSPYAEGGTFEDLSQALQLPETLGVAWGDYDGDGYPDLFLPGNEWFHPRGALLLHNNHDLTFTDATAAVGLPAGPTSQWGAAWADYDNDGDLDLLVTTFWQMGGGLSLYRNDDGAFVDGTEAAGLAGTTCSGTVAWCDYDGDNWLDFFAGPSSLFRSNRDGTFTEVAEPFGAGTGGLPEYSQAAWGDMDGDGLPDLVVTLGATGGIYVLTNRGGSTFSFLSSLDPVGGVTSVAGLALGDYDSDGRLDIYGSSSGWAPDVLLHSNGDGTFTDMGASAGLGSDTSIGAGVAWADYDDDGWLDVYVTNTNSGTGDGYLWHNDGDGTFHDAFAEAGLSTPAPDSGGNTAPCWADIDQDGRMDLLAAAVDGVGSYFYHNITPNRNWLRVRAVTSATGDATASGPVRDALGARVEVNVDNSINFLPGRTLTRLIEGGAGSGLQSEPIAHFGIPTDGPVAVRVTFPNGSVVVQKDTAVNQQTVVGSMPAERLFLFADVQFDFWAAAQIEACVQAGIVQGYPDGSYGPGIRLTRDQMAVYVARALAGGDAQVPTGPEAPTFPDVGTDHWAYRYVEYCRDAGVVQGYPDGGYHPDETVNRGQMAVYVARAVATPTGDAAVPEDTDGATFTDVTEASEWAWCYRYVEYCAGLGIVQGYWDGSYHPEREVTRDQMAVYVARAFALPR